MKRHEGCRLAPAGLLGAAMATVFVSHLRPLRLVCRASIRTRSRGLRRRQRMVSRRGCVRRVVACAARCFENDSWKRWCSSAQGRFLASRTCSSSMTAKVVLTLRRQPLHSYRLRDFSMTARQTLATANSTRATSPDFADTSPGADEPTAPPKTGRSRKIGFTTLGLVVLAAGVGWGAYEWMVASKYESTDDAYAQGNIVQITPQLGGTVIAIHAEDTDLVKAGDTLVQIDPADARLALGQAEAALAQAVRQVRTFDVDNGALPRADLAAASRSGACAVRTRRARSGDLQRREALAGQGAVSREELQHARDQANSASSAVAAARAGVAAAREQLASNRVRTDGTRCRRTPGRAGGGVQTARGVARDAAHHAARADRWPGRAPQRAARPARGAGHAADVARSRCSRSGSMPTSRKASSARSASASPRRSRPMCTAARSSTTARWRAWAPAPARRSRCCPRRTRPATGSRWCNGCRCASSSIRNNSRASAAHRPVDGRDGGRAAAGRHRAWRRRTDAGQPHRGLQRPGRWRDAGDRAHRGGQSRRQDQRQSAAEVAHGRAREPRRQRETGSESPLMNAVTHLGGRAARARGRACRSTRCGGGRRAGQPSPAVRHRADRRHRSRCRPPRS